MDTIVYFVYYYAPPILWATGLGGVPYITDFNIVGGLPIQSAIIPYENVLGLDLLGQVGSNKLYDTIYLTDNAANEYISNYLGYFSNLNPPIQQTPSEVIAGANEFMILNGYYWMPYDSNYLSNYNLAPSAVDPTQPIGTTPANTSSNLYMLILSASYSSSTLINVVVSSSGTTSGTNEELWNQPNITVAQAEANFNTINQSSNIQSASNIENVGTNLTNTLSQDISNLGKTISNDLNPLTNPYSLILYAGLGIAALVAIGLFIR